MKHEALTSLEKSWGGYSSFRPVRQADEDPVTPEDLAKMEKQAGLYGHTKRIQVACEGSVRKLARQVSRIARNLWNKDKKSAEFLTEYMGRHDSKAAHALLAGMSDIGPNIKLATPAPKGMYGFSNKTVNLCLGAIQSVQEQSGLVSMALYSRFPRDYHKILNFFDQHIQTENCPYSHLLASYFPSDRDIQKVASEKPTEADAMDAAHFFFADPKRMEVREFARSKAISNVAPIIPQVAKTYDQLDTSKTQLMRETKESPNTPAENLKGTPGSKEFSTLSRYLVMTAEPTHRDVPQSRDEIDKQPNLAIEHDEKTIEALNGKKASWTFCQRGD